MEMDQGATTRAETDDLGAAELTVAQSGVSGDRLSELVNDLADQMRHLPVEIGFKPSVGEPPEGARGPSANEIATILVSGGVTADLLWEVIRTLVEWRRSDSNRTVRVRVKDDELEISNATSVDQERLIREFISRMRRK